MRSPRGAALRGDQPQADAELPPALRAPATASRAAFAIRPLSLAMVTKLKPIAIIRAA